MTCYSCSQSWPRFGCPYCIALARQRSKREAIKDGGAVRRMRPSRDEHIADLAGDD